MSEPTQIDDFYLKFLKDYPEAIYEIGKWEIKALCEKCGSEIENETLLFPYTKSYGFYQDEDYWLDNTFNLRKCDYCHVACEKIEAHRKEKKITSGKLPHKTVKSRKIYSEPQKYSGWGWWKKPLPRQYAIETKIILDKSPKSDKTTT